MGAVAGALGFGSNDSKAGGFQGQGTNIQQPITSADAQQNLANQNAFIQALQAQNGTQNQSNVYNQLGAIANGQGPNPALAQLANATGANTANQAALMAGQRGASQNVGLIARQAAQQGAANQQNAVGQAAALQAQQSLNALGQQGNIAGQQVQNLGQNIAGQQGAELGSIQGVNQANVGMQSNINNANAGIAGINAQNQAKTAGGLGSSIGSGITSLLAHGGEVGKDGPKSILGRHMLKMAHGGKVDVILSPGEGYLPPDEAKEVVQQKKNPITKASIVPGEAKVKGDSLKNDTVPAKLEEGGIVIPRSIMEGKNAATEAAKFVAKHLKSKK